MSAKNNENFTPKTPQNSDDFRPDSSVTSADELVSKWHAHNNKINAQKECERAYDIALRAQNLAMSLRQSRSVSTASVARLQAMVDESKSLLRGVTMLGSKAGENTAKKAQIVKNLLGRIEASFLPRLSAVAVDDGGDAAGAENYAAGEPNSNLDDLADAGWGIDSGANDEYDGANGRDAWLDTKSSAANSNLNENPADTGGENSNLGEDLASKNGSTDGRDAWLCDAAQNSAQTTAAAATTAPAKTAPAKTPAPQPAPAPSGFRNSYKGIADRALKLAIDAKALTNRAKTAQAAGDADEFAHALTSAEHSSRDADELISRVLNAPNYKAAEKQTAAEASAINAEAKSLLIWLRGRLDEAQGESGEWATHAAQSGNLGSGFTEFLKAAQREADDMRAAQNALEMGANSNLEQTAARLAQHPASAEENFGAGSAGGADGAGSADFGASGAGGADFGAENLADDANEPHPQPVSHVTAAQFESFASAENLAETMHSSRFVNNGEPTKRADFADDLGEFDDGFADYGRGEKESAAALANLASGHSAADDVADGKVGKIGKVGAKNAPNAANKTTTKIKVGAAKSAENVAPNSNLSASDAGDFDKKGADFAGGAEKIGADFADGAKNPAATEPQTALDENEAISQKLADLISERAALAEARAAQSIAQLAQSGADGAGDLDENGANFDDANATQNANGEPPKSTLAQALNKAQSEVLQNALKEKGQFSQFDRGAGADFAANSNLGADFAGGAGGTGGAGGANFAGTGGANFGANDERAGDFGGADLNAGGVDLGTSGANDSDFASGANGVGWGSATNSNLAERTEQFANPQNASQTTQSTSAAQNQPATQNAQRQTTNITQPEPNSNLAQNANQNEQAANSAQNQTTAAQNQAPAQTTQTAQTANAAQNADATAQNIPNSNLAQNADQTAQTASVEQAQPAAKPRWLVTRFVRNLFATQNAAGLKGAMAGVTLVLAAAFGLELYQAWRTNSVALFADAMLLCAHATAVVFCFIATNFTKKSAGKFGYYKIFPITAILYSAFFTLVGLVGAVEAALRVVWPVAVNYAGVMFWASVGLLVKVAVGVLLSRRGDVFTRISLAQIVGDTLVSLAVIFAAAVSLAGKVVWLESVVALALFAVMLKWSVVLLADAVRFRNKYRSDTARIADFVRRNGAGVVVAVGGVAIEEVGGGRFGEVRVRFADGVGDDERVRLQKEVKNEFLLKRVSFVCF